MNINGVNIKLVDRGFNALPYARERAIAEKKNVLVVLPDFNKTVEVRAKKGPVTTKHRNADGPFRGVNDIDVVVTKPDKNGKVMKIVGAFASIKSTEIVMLMNC